MNVFYYILVTILTIFTNSVRSLLAYKLPLLSGYCIGTCYRVTCHGRHILYKASHRDKHNIYSDSKIRGLRVWYIKHHRETVFSMSDDPLRHYWYHNKCPQETLHLSIVIIQSENYTQSPNSSNAPYLNNRIRFGMSLSLFSLRIPPVQSNVSIHLYTTYILGWS